MLFTNVSVVCVLFSLVCSFVCVSVVSCSGLCCLFDFVVLLFLCPVVWFVCIPVFVCMLLSICVR